MGLQHPLTANEAVAVVLRLADGREVRTTVTARAP
jgi:hypothetical protein